MPDLIWHGDEAMDHVRRRAVQGLIRACILLSRRARELLSVAGTSKAGGGGGRGGATVFGADRSAPGEPPRKQTGRLRESVAYEVDERALEGRVGTNVPYGKYLELGTRRGILPRPWLRRALAEVSGQIMQIMAGIGGK